ncbi:MAG: SAM-dependent methyltransferase [Verrucomicrobiales bacterium]|nr:SAM-dependent methyltransferase [Verrucomicrobiales bacterium]
MSEPTPDPIESFIRRWEESGGHERANYQLFLSELCAILEVPPPDPAQPENEKNAYVFERSVTRVKPDGTATTNYLDLYKSGHFVLETKQGATAKKSGKDGQEVKLDLPSTSTVSTGHGKRGTAGYDKAMEKAYNQASGYISDLPAEDGRPPFLIVCDVGHVFEIYAEFTRSGGRYQRFPDPKNHRIYLEDLRDPKTRELLRTIWTDPMSLDPSKRVAKVTRDIAGRLADLARSLEADKHNPELVALFLQRCLFTMFAEDIGLLPKDGFLNLLKKIEGNTGGFVAMITSLWNDMAKGTDYSVAIMEKVAYFNGGLFENPTALPLSEKQIGLLIHAAKSDWTEVDPAIFGTLLERALDPRERHKLGAHYTPRSYVERLIEPTIMEPLRDEWQAVKTAAVQYLDQDKIKKAREEVEDFHHRLCDVKVLDPACGSGNFLYVALEHLKRLEAEVLDFFESIGGNRALEMDSFKVRPNQFLGIEINPSAARIAQLVLWIGYFQWQHRTTGTADTNDRPLLQGKDTIENRDAVLEYDERIPRLDEDGKVVRIWDGQTTKPHPVTGKEVPDESATIDLFDYVNPRRPEWPEADFVVGNPPFVGASRMRDFLGDGYTEAVRTAWKGDVPESADFVMFWWQRSAELVRAGKIHRFGLITTNSIRQTFNRRVLEPHLNAEKNPMHLAFAIPDHPWVDSADGAAVRIAMTVGEFGFLDGELHRVTEEFEIENGEHDVSIETIEGTILANLRSGAAISSADRLTANLELSNRGHELGGSGFILTRVQAKNLGYSIHSETYKYIREYRNGRDITEKSRDVLLIDLYGLGEKEVASKVPSLYQHVLNHVKPERDQNRNPRLRQFWWLHRRLREDLRRMVAELPRYIATVETSKHRFFVFLDKSILPDNMLVNIAVDDAYHLGILSSKVHVHWALAAGGRLGYGNDPRYNKTRCFETFPFPDPGEATRERIRELGEKLDAHRKRQQQAHPDLTLTGIYNVLEKLRSGEALTDKERKIHDDGLVTVQKQIHDELDEAVFHAYGWDDLWQRLQNGEDSETVEAELLERLVALNHERAEEEKRGLVRWLRPEFQAPEENGLPKEKQEEIEFQAEKAAAKPKIKVEKQKWPTALPEQVAAIQKLLPALGPDAKALSEAFGRTSKKRIGQVEEILSTLAALGQL